MSLTATSHGNGSRPRTGSVSWNGCGLYYEDRGEGVPILLIHPAGATASTWGSIPEQLARIGRVITYDRRGYARSGGEVVRAMPRHTADAAAILDHLRTPPAVVVGTSAGAAIAVDLAVRRPDLVRAVVVHEFPWRFTRQVPSASQVASLLKIGWLTVRRREEDAAEELLRSAYAYGEGGSAWDAFPEEWRRTGRENASAALADFRNSIRSYPSAADLATIDAPVICSYGARSPSSMVRLVRSLASAIPTGRTSCIEGAGHAAPFDAPANFVRLIADACQQSAVSGAPGHPERAHEGTARRRRLERLTASDLFLLLWDDYGWSTDIGGLAILDGTGLFDDEGHIRVDAVRGHIAARLHLVPRFRQILYRPRMGLGWPLWLDAPSFDLADHIRVHPLREPADEARLLEACQELTRRRLDPDRPLWELWLLPGLPDGRVGALLKLHHVLADGPAAMAAFGALLDPTADAPAPEAPPWSPTPIPFARELLRDNLRRRGQELRRGCSGLLHPSRTLRRARRTLPAWREVLTDKPAPRTSLNQPVGTERRLAVVRRRLEPAKQIAHGHHAKVNDVVLAAVAGGLRELLASRGERVDGLVQRAMVTISQHQEEPGQARGNKPGWMMVPLPLGVPDPVRRLELIAAETAARKGRDRPEVGSGIFRFVAGQRVWYRLFPRQRSVNVVVSNVAGPPVPLHLAGARLLELFPMMPPMGNLTLVVAAMSYTGQLNLTAAADRDRCPDVAVFAHGVAEALDQLEQPSPVRDRPRVAVHATVA